MNDHLYIGVDLGTSVTKGTMIDQACNVIAETAHIRSEHHIKQGQYEHDPDEDWWLEFISVVQCLIRTEGVNPLNVCAVAVTGMIPNICLVDRKGHPVRKAVLFYDNRAEHIEKELEDLIGTPHFQNEVLAKLCWLKREMGSDWNNVNKILSTHNYIVSKLTGVFSIDTVTAAEFGPMYCHESATWNHDLLQRFGIDDNILPMIAAPCHIIGEVTDEASKASGLPAGIPVSVGTCDTISTLVGCGAYAKSDLLISYGTYGCAAITHSNIEDILLGTFKKYPFDWVASIPRAGQQLVGMAQTLTGITDKSNALRTVDQFAAQSTPGSNGVVFIQSRSIPHAANSTEPIGAFLELKNHSTMPDLCRALLEAFGFGLRLCFEHFAVETENRIAFAASGGAKSSLWRQIVSDIVGLDQTYFPHNERGYGSAVIAACTYNIKMLSIAQEKIFMETQHTKQSYPLPEEYKRNYSIYEATIKSPVCQLT
jgi:xylulokinase